MNVMRLGLFGLAGLSLAVLLASLIPPPRATDAQLVELAGADSPASFQLDYPTHIRLGTSEPLSLSFRLEGGAPAGAQTVVELASACLLFAPPGDTAQALRPGVHQKWHWTLTPSGEPGACPFTLVVRLRQPAGHERLIFVRNLTTRLDTFFGVDAVTARAAALITGIISLALLAVIRFRSST